MHTICKMLGHDPPKRSVWGAPYLRIKTTAVDGMGTVHAYLYGECERCGEEYHIANVHLPKEGEEKGVGKGF